MKKSFFTIGFALFALAASAQITITDSSLLWAGGTVNNKNVSVTSLVNPSVGATAQSWDYSGLTAISNASYMLNASANSNFSTSALVRDAMAENIGNNVPYVTT